MSAKIEFGFVPSKTVSALKDLGNWKVRADAIESLHRLVLNLPDGGRAALPSLHAFVGFLNRLLADPNFKISLTTLQIWTALLEKVGAEARTVVPVVVPTLVKKLGDTKDVVRQANTQVVNTLYNLIPGATMNALLSAFNDVSVEASATGRETPYRNSVGPSSAREKEDAIGAVCGAMLDPTAYPHKDVENARLIAKLLAAAQAEEDNEDMARARAVAVEALAVASRRCGKQETWRLIDRAADRSGGIDRELRKELTARLDNDHCIPSLTHDGFVEHCEAAAALLTRPRLEDGARRSLEVFPGSAPSIPGGTVKRGSFMSMFSKRRSASATPSESGSRSSGGSGSAGGEGSQRGGQHGLGASGFHASLLKQRGGSVLSMAERPGVGSSPSGVAGGAIPSIATSTSSVDVSPEGSRRGTPRVSGNAGLGSALNRRAAAANAARNVRANGSGNSTPASHSGSSASGGSRAGWDNGDVRAPSVAARRMQAREGIKNLRISTGADDDDSQYQVGPLSSESDKTPKDATIGHGLASPVGSPSRRPDSVDSTQGKLSALKARRGRTPPTLSRTSSLDQRASFDSMRPSAQPRGSPAAMAAAAGGHFARGGVATPKGFGRGNQPANVGADEEDAFAKRPTATRSPAASPNGKSNARRSLVGRPGSGSLLDANATPLEELTTEQLLPLETPDAALRKAVKSLTTAATAKPMELDWLAQHEGLITVRRLVVHHGRTVIPALHAIVLGVIAAIDALRSSIAKLAMQTVVEMTTFLDPRAMEAELDYLAPALAKKSGETNWLGVAADDALAGFIRHLADTRVLASLITSAKHKNPTVRLRVATHVEACCEGAADGAFYGSAASRDLLEKTFAAVVPLLEEGAAETRAMAKRAVCHLQRHLRGGSEFDKLLKGLPERKKQAVRDVIEKGPPPLPPRSGSATPRGGRYPSSSLGSPIGSPKSAGGFGGLDERGSGSSRGSSRGTSRGAAGSSRMSIGVGGGVGGGGGGVAGAHLKEALTPVFAKLKSKNWQERGAAIAELEEVMTSAPTGAFGEELAVAVFDALVPRLADGNAKVSVQAFTMLAGVLPVLGDDVTPALGSLVPALAAGVGGANEKTRAAATAASDALIESCSATSLVQHVSHSVCFGVSRAKPVLLEYLVDLAEAVYPARPQLVVKHAVPAAVTCLANEKSAAIKAANARLLRALAGCLGKEALAQHAGGISAAAKKKVEDALKAM